MLITDLEPYRPYIDKFDLMEEQNLELVNTISVIAEVILDGIYSKPAIGKIEQNEKQKKHPLS